MHPKKTTESDRMHHIQVIGEGETRRYLVYCLCTWKRKEENLKFLWKEKLFNVFFVWNFRKKTIYIKNISQIEVASKDKFGNKCIKRIKL